MKQAESIQAYPISPDFGDPGACANRLYQAVFSSPAKNGLGTRLRICQNIDFWRPSSSLMTSRVFCAVVMTMTMSTCFKSRVGVMAPASLYSVVLASFVAQVKGVMFYDLSVSGAGWGDGVYLVRAPYNPYDCICGVRVADNVSLPRTIKRAQ